MLHSPSVSVENCPSLKLDKRIVNRGTVILSFEQFDTITGTTSTKSLSKLHDSIYKLYSN